MDIFFLFALYKKLFYVNYFLNS